LDRSRDLVPYLVGMAVAEWWYGVRAVGHRLDTAAEEETNAALSALAGPVRLSPWPDLMDATPTSFDRSPSPATGACTPRAQCSWSSETPGCWAPPASPKESRDGTRVGAG